MFMDKKNVRHTIHKTVSGTAILKHLPYSCHSLPVRYKHRSLHSHRCCCSTHTHTFVSLLCPLTVHHNIASVLRVRGVRTAAPT